MSTKKGGKSGKTRRSSPAVKPGRPRTYNPAYHDGAAEKLTAKCGFDTEMLSVAFGVSKSAVSRWLDEHETFRESVKRGKDVFDTDLVEVAAMRRATGFYQPVKKVFTYEGKPVIVETEEYFPPDPSTLRMWLFNRRGERWRDKREVNHGATGELAAILQGLDGGTRGLGQAGLGGAAVLTDDEGDDEDQPG